MYIKLKSITVHISFFFGVFLALAANTIMGRTYILSLICAFFHECVHIFFLKKLGCGKIFLTLSFSGIKMQAEGFSTLTYNKIMLCTISAPVMNLVTGVVLLCAFIISEKNLLYTLSYINIITGAVNLLPLPFLDGGRFIAAFLSKRYDELTVRRVCNILSVLSLAILASVFITGFFMGKLMFFLLFFFFYCTIGYISDKLT